jgi:4-alpha-glucanotransferase
MQRRAGILLHPTALPSPYGIGDFGPAAYQFVDFLSVAGQKLWQVLPLTLTDVTGSPYASCSALAGNYLLISPDQLAKDNLLKQGDVPRLLDTRWVQYGRASREKNLLIKKSLEYFQTQHTAVAENDFRLFRKKQTWWLADFALFMALKDHFKGRPWHRWPDHLAGRQKKALQAWRKKLRHEILFYEYSQWLFSKQWLALKSYANHRGISIIGDVPFFVIADSADVWVNKKLFQLDKRNLPKSVSGVPPDYFSARGQIWGDPQFDWQELQRTNFKWCVQRFNMAFQMYNLVRLDHFRGYSAVWHIRRGSRTGRIGTWVSVPGSKLFSMVRKKMHKLPFIAEDLGVITPDVTALREKFHLPSTRILQFSFDGLPHNNHQPALFSHDVVAYTGTHDNDTSRGWITRSGRRHERRNALRQTKTTPEHFAWKLITMGQRSKADTFIAPLQDVLNLGSEARFNKPGTKQKNWRWRYSASMLTGKLAKQLKKTTVSSHR